MTSEVTAWMILDDTGNLVDAFDDEAAARDAYDALETRLGYSLVGLSAGGNIVVCLTGTRYV